MQPNKLVELANPEEVLTLAATSGLNIGSASKIIGLASTRNQLTHLSLIDLVRLRLTKRRNPAYDSFEDFVKIRTCCNIVEEIGGEFYCDCQQVLKPSKQYSWTFMQFGHKTILQIFRASRESCVNILSALCMPARRTSRWILE